MVPKKCKIRFEMALLRGLDLLIFRVNSSLLGRVIETASF